MPAPAQIQYKPIVIQVMTMCLTTILLQLADANSVKFMAQIPKWEPVLRPRWGEQEPMAQLGHGQKVVKFGALGQITHFGYHCGVNKYKQAESLLITY